MKLLTTILALLITVLTVLPCCQADSCDNEKTKEEQAAADRHPSEGKACSPFYSCATCAGFVLEGSSSVEAPFEITEIQFYTTHPTTFITRFHHSIWQPPRIS